jgi:hypothetical protein
MNKKSEIYRVIMTIHSNTFNLNFPKYGWGPKRVDANPRPEQFEFPVKIISTNSSIWWDGVPKRHAPLLKRSSLNFSPEDGVGVKHL